MKKKYLTLAAVAMMFAACSQNDDPVLLEKDTPITIASAGVNELVASRGESTALTTGSLGLYVTGTDLDAKYTATNVEWKYENGEWKNQSESPLLFAGENKQSAYAYHPYVADAYTNGFTTNGTTDLLWWKSESALTSASFLIEFSHALSKLTIDLKKGTEVADLTISEVKVAGTVPTATPNFAGQTWSIAEGATAADITATAATTTTGMDATYTALLVPQETSALKVVIITSDNRVFAYTHSVAHEFVKGTAYTLELKVGGDKVEAGTISAAKWTSVTPSDNLVTE